MHGQLTMEILIGIAFSDHFSIFHTNRILFLRLVVFVFYRTRFHRSPLGVIGQGYRVHYTWIKTIFLSILQWIVSGIYVVLILSFTIFIIIIRLHFFVSFFTKILYLHGGWRYPFNSASCVSLYYYYNCLLYRYIFIHLLTTQLTTTQQQVRNRTYL